MYILHKRTHSMPVVHDVRFSVDMLRAKYTQWYYNTDRNPRVIHTRLPQQQLLSLRTWPRDKYLIKPGEFLTLARRHPKVSLASDYRQHLRPAYLKGVFESFDDMAISDRPAVHVSPRRTQSAVECACLCHHSLRKLKLKRRIKQISSKLLEALFLDSASTLVPSPDPRPTQKYGPSTPPPRPPQPPQPSSVTQPSPTTQASPMFLTPMHSPARPTTPSPGRHLALSPSVLSDSPISLSPILGYSPFSSPSGKTPTKVPVWHRVLSEVSLNAARVSTGHPPSLALSVSADLTSYTEVDETFRCELFSLYGSDWH